MTTQSPDIRAASRGTMRYEPGTRCQGSI